jgi:CubicO group peptidase (beta-lactamase class C family)
MILFHFNLFSQVKNTLQPVAGFEQAQSDSIAKFITDFPNNTQFSIAFVKNGTVHYLGALRQQDTLQNIQNHHSIFEIGSITKVFTSALLAQLVQEGMVQLDDPIQKHLPFKLHQAEKNGRVITLQTLANHTAGLPRLPENIMPLLTAFPNDPYKNYTEKELEQYLQNQLTLKTPPGTQHDYSNLGAGLLGYMLSKKTDKSYATLLQEKIFTPLQMKYSSVNEPVDSNKLVKGLNIMGEATPRWHLAALAGAGAMLSTVEDLSKFVQANFKPNPAFDLQRKKTQTINEKMDVALGWHLIKSKDGATWHWHNGGTGGYTSSLVMDVEQQTAVIILSNISAFHKKMGNVDQLAFALMRSL